MVQRLRLFRLSNHNENGLNCSIQATSSFVIKVLYLLLAVADTNPLWHVTMKNRDKKTKYKEKNMANGNFNAILGMTTFL